MLIRYPGLSLVSVFGMAVGIAIATGASTVVAALMDTRLPLPGGERIVSLLNIDVSTNNQEFRLLRDSEEWRGLSSIEDPGMSRSTSKNLIVEGRAPEAITVTEISSSAFRVAGVAALRGRPLLDADASPDAEPAVVIGHEEWVRRFGADPDIADRPVQLGEVTYTIVGVMPEGFAFPAYHSFWIPWRLDGTAAGIYALMSFTVARRRREIGIRAALGADRNLLLAGIFGRVVLQLSMGAAVGFLGAYGLELITEGELLEKRGAIVLPLVAVVMMSVGLIAAWGPARQGLGIQPTEALRDE